MPIKRISRGTRFRFAASPGERSITANFRRPKTGHPKRQRSSRPVRDKSLSRAEAGSKDKRERANPNRSR